MHPRLLKSLGGIGVLGFVLGGVLSCQAFRWTVVKLKTHRAFPRVGQISTANLAAWLSDAKRTPPVLLDVRTPAEYAVSHLAGAIRVEPGSKPGALHLPLDAPIVTYCSVGYRSSDFGEKMLQAGFKNVRNLDGSIFAWANENRPLVHDGEPTSQVHPFNPAWGTLLDKSHRANVPPVQP